MFSHLKKLIADGVRKRRPRRPDRLPRFRGQLEQLESRTVLSATMGPVGPMAIEFVAIAHDANSITVIAVWESRPASAPQLALNSFNQFGDAPWETAGWNNRFAGPGPRGGLAVENYYRPPLAPTGGNDQTSTGSVAVTDDFAGDRNVLSHPKDQPLGLNGGNQAGSNGFVSPAGESRGPSVATILWRGNPTGAENYFSSLANSAGTTELTTATRRSPLKTADTVFDAYSADSLLLAYNSNSKHDLDLDGDLDDKDSRDQNSDFDNDSNDSIIGTDATASLDALQRERAAIDAVLAELHEIKLDRENHRAESASADRSPHRTAAESLDRESFTAAARIASQAVNQAADGGMVLLQPSGDANSSAYDLTAVFFNGLVDNAALPLGVEASVGMYQAIDVGTSELRPTSRETLPLAQPSGAARPSVSAENAPT